MISFTDACALIVLQQMVQIFVFASFTKVQCSHSHSWVGASGGGPRESSSISSTIGEGCLTGSGVSCFFGCT